MKLTVNCDGILYPVEAVCTSEEEANALCALNPALTVMGEDGSGHCYLVSSAKPDTNNPMPLITEAPLKQYSHAAKFQAGAR